MNHQGHQEGCFGKHSVRFQLSCIVIIYIDILAQNMVYFENMSVKQKQNLIFSHFPSFFIKFQRVIALGSIPVLTIHVYFVDKVKFSS